MKKLWSFLLVSALLCSILTVPALAETSDLSGKITVVISNSYTDEMDAIIAKYHETRPNVEIVVEPYSFSQLFETIEIKLGSKDDSFDMMFVDAPMVAGYGFRNYLAPLDEYFTEEEKAQYTEAAVNAGTYNGQFLAPPLTNSAGILVYNIDLLEAAGLPIPSSDPEDRMTWEELAEDMVAFQEAVDPNRDQGIWAFSFDQISRPYQVLPLPNSLGGQGIGDDGLTVEGVLNSQAWIDSMQFYSDLHNTLNVAPKGPAADETYTFFVSGKMAYFITGTWIIDYCADNPDLNWGYAPFPYFENGEPATCTGSWHLGVSEFSNNKEIAADFLKFLSLGEGNDIFLDMFPQVPARKDKLEGMIEGNDPTYNEFPYSLFKLAAYEAVNTAVPRPVTPAYREWEQMVAATMEDIRNGADVTESLNSVTMQLNSSLQKYR